MRFVATLASRTWRIPSFGIEAALAARLAQKCVRRAASTSPPPPAIVASRQAEDTSSAVRGAQEVLCALSARGLPCFAVPPSSVRVLASPSDLYDTLLAGARSARHRVSLASLYLGSGESESRLVDELVASQHRAPARHLSLLLDYHRARRPGALTLASRLAATPRTSVHLLASPSAPPPSAGTQRDVDGGAGRIFSSERLPGGLSEVSAVRHAKAAAAVHCARRVHTTTLRLTTRCAVCSMPRPRCLTTAYCSQGPTSRMNTSRRAR